MVSVTWPFQDFQFPSNFRRSKAKVLLARIKHTPFTLVFFILAFLTCVVMVALQLVLYADNTFAVNKLSGIIASANISQGIAINANGVLQYCHRITGTDAASCVPIAPTVSNGTGFILTWKRQEQAPGANTENANVPSARSVPTGTESKRLSTIPGRTPTQTSSTIQEGNCPKALLWLEGTLNDARREDVVTFAFQFWLFSLAAVAVLSESLPHLGASLLGHILGTVWAGTRVRASYTMMDFYDSVIVSGSCSGVNPLDDWWQVKISHAISVAVVNGIALIFMLFLSFKLYKVYADLSFSYVGATPVIERILRIVNMYSVSLHLTLFFVIASSAIWINKATSSIVGFLAANDKIFLAGAALTIVLIIPWIIVGWLYIRHECQWRFLSFCLITIILLTISTVMFWSGLYRLVFTSWPFFTTITVTAHVMVIISLVLAIWCRFNFGHGFSHFIQVSEVLENMDFPSVYFSKDEEAGIKNNQTLEFPPVPPTNSAGRSALRPRIMRASVYSNHNVATVKLTSSQPLYSETVNSSLSPSPSVTSVTQRLRRVFEYRKTQESSLTVPVPPLPQLQASTAPIHTTLAQLPESEEVRSTAGKKTDRSKRRSRSVSFGRSSTRTRDGMETVTGSAVLDIPQRRKTGRPLPLRPLPKPPTSAPTSPIANTSGPLARRGGIREPGPNHRLDRVDLRPVEQW